MPTKKKPVKLTQEELFPHGKGFGYRLEFLDENKLTRLCWFQCEHHLTTHINRYRITEGRVDVMDGEPPLSADPLAAKTRKSRKAPAKAKTTTAKKQPSRSKASQASTTKKPAKLAAKTTRPKRATKTTKKQVFSTVTDFFEQ